MQKILIPTDFSENAWNAIDYAMQLFRNRRCTFYLLNTYTPVIPSSRFMAKMIDGVAIVDAVRENSEQGLYKTVKRIKTKYGNPNHSFETISSFNLLVEDVKDIVETFGIHLVVTGTKGASGVDEVFMGSNAHKVIKTIDFCPIIAVPNQWKPNNKADQILLATGFEHLFEGYEFEPLLDFAKLVESKILVGYVGDSSDFSAEQQSTKKLTERFLRDTDVEFIAIKEVGFIHESIQRYIENNPRIGMLAMINYWHNFIEKLMQEPTIKKMAFNCNVPLLVTHILD